MGEGVYVRMPKGLEPVVISREVGRFRAERGYGPTLGELAERLGVRVRAVAYWVPRMLEEGLIEVDRLPSGKVVGRSWRMVVSEEGRDEQVQ